MGNSKEAERKEEGDIGEKIEEKKKEWFY